MLPLSDPRARSLRNAGIQVVSISDVLRGFVWSGPAVTHLLLGTLEGAGYLEAQGRRRELRPGDFVLAPAGIPRSLGTESANWRFLAVRLTADARPGLLERGVQSLGNQGLKRALAPVEGMFAQIGATEVVQALPQTKHEDPLSYLESRYAEQLRPRVSVEADTAPASDAFALYASILKTEVEALIAACEVSRPAEVADEEIALANLWTSVRERPAFAWGADDLATRLGVSRTVLYRLVKQWHGTSPARVVEGIRMAEARRLLSERRDSTALIAEAVGYANAFSFSAAFKRVVGEPPSSFRKRVAQEAGLHEEARNLATRRSYTRLKSANVA